MPTIRVPSMGLASSITPTPARPAGGTAFTSAATRSWDALARSSSSITCTPAAATPITMSAGARASRNSGRVRVEAEASTVSKRLPVSCAAASAASRPLWLPSTAVAPAREHSTAAMRPTGPVPPSSNT